MHCSWRGWGWSRRTGPQVSILSNLEQKELYLGTWGRGGPEHMSPAPLGGSPGTAPTVAGEPAGPSQPRELFTHQTPTRL